MQFSFDGHAYVSTQDAAQELGVRAGTLRAYIRDRILPEPPMCRVGLRNQRGFDPQYIAAAKKTLTDLAGRKRP